MADRYTYATGRRKTAVAQIRIYPGAGEIVVNEKPVDEYFSALLVGRIRPVLELVGRANKVRVSAKVSGGGKAGQADAVVLGLARALAEEDPSLRVTLKRTGYLSRDAREKERKKYGLKRARKAPQFSKR